MFDRCLSIGSVCCVQDELMDCVQHDSEEGRISGRRRPLPVLANLRRSLHPWRDASVNVGHDSLATRLRRGFIQSDYDLSDVQCEIDSSTVHLYGIVRSYHALQIAIQITRSIAVGNRIELDIDVVPKLHKDQRSC